MVSDNMALRKISGPKKDEIIGGWRKLHTEEFLNFYLSPNIIGMMKRRMMRWAGHVTHVKNGTAYRVWWEIQKEERPLGKPKCRWEDNIKIKKQEGGMDWTSGGLL
jgi:hypothetical protein